MEKANIRCTIVGGAIFEFGACPLLLVVVGRGASQSKAVRRDAREDLGATCAGRLKRLARNSRSGELPRGKVGAIWAGWARAGLDPLDRTRSKGQIAEDRRTERASSAKKVAAQEWLSCPIRAGMAKVESRMGAGALSVKLVVPFPIAE